MEGMNAGMIADIVCLAIVAIFGITNMAKGFFKQIFKVVCVLGALVIAYFFCDEAAAFLNAQWDLDNLFASKILGFFGDKQVVFLELTNENIATAISALGLPEFITEYAVNSLNETALTTYNNVGQYLSSILSHYAVLGISFIGVCIIARIVLFIVRKIVELIVKLPIIKGIDKLLGLVWGVLQAAILLFVVIYIIDILPLEALSNLKLALSQSMIGSYIQEQNFFATIMNWILSTINI